MVGDTMKYFLALLAIISTTVAAETVINYDDGSTYTLKEGEEIYVSPKSSTLFKRRVMGNKDTFFTAQKPWPSRDYVPEPQDPFQVGSHEWCKAYVPWSEGLTFDMIAWNRHCDTDNDGKYGCGDDTFDSSEEGSVCSP
jgi:hypothetical protein